MNDYSLELDLRIDWSEIDLFGHVNNVAILKYIQAARVNYLEKLGLMPFSHEKDIVPILAYTGCQFRKPLFYPGHVTIRSRIDSVGNTSFRILHKMINDRDEVIAESEDILVTYNPHKQERLAIPDDLRDIIEKLENRKFSK